MPFEDTLNKATIRREFDLPILEELAKRKSRKLFYFGLTGPKMYDIVDWRQYLQPPITSAEEEDFNENASSMLRIGEDIGLSVQIMRGQIEYVMRHGKDYDGAFPRLSHVGPDGYRYFTYDVINLDFDGGVGNVFHRHDSIVELFKRQAKTECVLFLTFNVRSQLTKPIKEALKDLTGRLGTGVATEALAWYESATEHALQLKAVVPGIIVQAASSARLDCKAYPPIIYDGTKAKLVHFVFHMIPREDAFRGFAQQSELRLFSLPTFYVSQGALELKVPQAPGFSLDDAAEDIAFLGDVSAGNVRARFNARTVEFVQKPLENSPKRQRGV